MRLIGVGVAGLEKEGEQSQNLFSGKTDKRRESLEELPTRFAVNSVSRLFKGRR